MANSIWKAAEEIKEMVDKLIANRHPDLALVSDHILVVFREKAGKSGGQVVYGKAFKCSDYMNVVGGTNYSFIIELGADTWSQELNEQQREALLDSILCSMVVEEDERSGDIRLGTIKPDIQAFRKNVEEYGMWFPKDEEEEEEVKEETQNQE